MPSDDPLVHFRGGDIEHRVGQEAKTYRHDTRRRSDATHVVLQLTLAGEQQYRDRKLGPGKAWCDVIPGRFVYGNGEPGEALSLVFVSFTGSIARAWQREIAGRFGPVLRFADAAAVEADMRQLIRLRDESAQRGDVYTMAARCYGFLMSVRLRLEQGRLDRDPLAASALQLIDRAAGESSLTVSSLAEQMQVSREHLGRRFKQATGHTLSDAIVNAKLRRVVRELRDGDTKLQTIASTMGFGSASYLCRVFRRRYGITPGELRRRPWLAVP